MSDVTSTAILIPTSNTVELMLPDGEYSAVDDQVEIPVGSSIRTTSEGEATIIFADNSILSMDVSTEIRLDEIPTLESQNTSVFQLLGNTWHRVQSVSNGGSYEVETESLIAAVRGTSFGVELEGEGDEELNQVIVSESNVDVAEKFDGQPREFQRVTQDEYIAFTRREILDNKRPAIAAVTEAQRARIWVAAQAELEQQLMDIDRNELFIEPGPLLERLDVRNEQIKQRVDTYRERITTQIQKEVRESISSSLIDLQSDVLQSDRPLEQVKQIFGNPQLGGEYCERIDGFTFDEVEQKLAEFGAESGTAEVIVKSRIMQVEYAFMYCEDGRLDQAELTKLKELGDQADIAVQQSSSKLGITSGESINPEFELAVNQYFDQFYRGSNGGINCGLILQTSDADFVNGIIEVEDQYQVARGDHNVPLQDFQLRRHDCESVG